MCLPTLQSNKIYRLVVIPRLPKDINLILVHKSNDPDHKTGPNDLFTKHIDFLTEKK